MSLRYGQSTSSAKQFPRVWHNYFFVRTSVESEYRQYVAAIRHNTHQSSPKTSSDLIAVAFQIAVSKGRAIHPPNHIPCPYTFNEVFDNILSSFNPNGTRFLEGKFAIVTGWVERNWPEMVKKLIEEVYHVVPRPRRYCAS